MAYSVEDLKKTQCLEGNKRCLTGLTLKLTLLKEKLTAVFFVSADNSEKQVLALVRVDGGKDEAHKQILRSYKEISIQGISHDPQPAEYLPALALAKAWLPAT